MDKQDFKKSKEELQDYLSFRRRGSKVAPKKGKGSFKRKEKHKEDLRDQRSRLAHLPYKQEVSGSNPLFRTKYKAISLPQNKACRSGCPESIALYYMPPQLSWQSKALLMLGPRVRAAPGAPYRGDIMYNIPKNCAVCPYESSCDTAMHFSDCRFYFLRTQKISFLAQLKQFFGRVFS